MLQPAGLVTGSKFRPGQKSDLSVMTERVDQLGSGPVRIVGLNLFTVEPRCSKNKTGNGSDNQ